MKYASIVVAALIVICAGCAPAVSKAPIKSTPRETADCASGLLESLGYQVLGGDDDVRGERARHASTATSGADYDRITVSIGKSAMRVHGETVSMTGAVSSFGGGGTRRGTLPANPGSYMIVAPSSALRAEVRRIAAECGGV